MIHTAGLSIVVATCNRPLRLATLLDSFTRLESPELPYEVIVVDNGPADDTRAEVERFAARASMPVRYALESRRGVSYARNAGADLASHTIVAFTDDDQHVAPDWLVAIVRAFRDHPEIDVVVGSVQPHWSQAPPDWLTHEWWGAAGIIDRGSQPFRVSRNRWMCLPGGNMAWRRAALLALGGFSPRCPRSEDRELTVRYLLTGKEGWYAPDMVVYHHRDGAQLTKGFFRNWYRTEGYMRARFGGEELFTPDGYLRPIPDDMPKILGVSRYVYRQWLRAMRAYIVARVRLRALDAFRHEVRVVFLSSYLRRRIELTATPGGPLMHRVGAAIARRRTQRMPAVS
jgi:glycosyltransferase involved in cell wall biosynthesis